MKRRHISLCMAIALTITSVFPGGIVTAEEAPAAAAGVVSEEIGAETSDIAEAAPQAGQDEAMLPEEQTAESEAQSQDSEADAILDEAEDTDEAADPADGSVVNAEAGQIAVEGVEVVPTPAMTVEEIGGNWCLEVTPDTGSNEMFEGQSLHFTASIFDDNDYDDGDVRPPMPDYSVEWSLANEEGPWDFSSCMDEIDLEPDDKGVTVRVGKMMEGSTSPYSFPLAAELKINGTVKDTWDAWVDIYPAEDGYYEPYLELLDENGEASGREPADILPYEEVSAALKLRHRTAAGIETANFEGETISFSADWLEIKKEDGEILDLGTDYSASSIGNIKIKRTNLYSDSLTMQVSSSGETAQRRIYKKSEVTWPYEEYSFTLVPDPDSAYLYTDTEGEITYTAEGDILEKIPATGGLSWDILNFDGEVNEELTRLLAGKGSGNQIVLSGKDFEAAAEKAGGMLSLQLRASLLADKKDPDSVLREERIEFYVRTPREYFGFSDLFYDYYNSDLERVECLTSDVIDIWADTAYYEIENSQYPGDEALEGKAYIRGITVEVTSEDAPKKAVTITENEGEDEAYWTLRTYSPCEATIKIKYERDDKVTGEYELPFVVTGEAYDVTLDQSDLTLCTGGDSAILHANVTCRTPEGSGTFTEGLAYNWEIIQEEEEAGPAVVSIKPDAIGGCTVTTTDVKGYAEIKVTVSKGDTVLGSATAYVSVNDYKIADESGTETPFEVYLLDGETAVIKPVLYNGLTPVEDAKYHFEDDGEFELPPTDESGFFAKPNADGTYTVKLLEDYGTSIGVYAYSKDALPEDVDEDEGYLAYASWMIRPISDEFYFEGDSDAVVYDDGTVSLKVIPGEGLLERGDLKFDVRAHIYKFEEDDPGKEISVSEDCYTAVGSAVTIIGSKLNAWQEKTLTSDQYVSEYRVYAYAVQKGTTKVIAQAYPAYLQLLESEEWFLEERQEKGKALMPGDVLEYQNVTLHLKNAAHPNGADIPYKVTKLEAHDVGGSGTTDLAEVKETDGKWTVEIRKAPGDFTLAATAVPQDTAYGTEEKSFTIHLAVLESVDRYELSIEGGTGTRYIVPGQKQSIVAKLVHVTGTVVEGKPVYTSVPVAADEYTLNFYSSGNMSVFDDGTVTAYRTGESTIHVEAYDSQNEWLASLEIRFSVCDYYYQIEADNFYNAPVDGTVTIMPKLLRYDSGSPEKPEEIDDITFSLTKDWAPESSKSSTAFTVSNPTEGETFVGGFTLAASREMDDYGYPMSATFSGKISFCNHENMNTTPEIVDLPSCEKPGKQGFSCKDCGFVPETVDIPALSHTWEYWYTEYDADCGHEGTEMQKCWNCGAERLVQIPPTGKHVYGNWKTVTPATVTSPAQQQGTCTVCGAKGTRSYGAKLAAFARLNVTSIPLKVKQSTKVVKVEMAAGDSIVSWTSSNKKIATVSASGKITGKKKGTAKITVKLASGKTASVKVKVQSPKVTTKKIKGVAKKLTLTKGQKAKLTPQLYPLTSVDKIKYTSSNKKVATVDKKGNIKAKKKGTAKITVKSGKKKVVCKVTVK